MARRPLILLLVLTAACGGGGAAAPPSEVRVGAADGSAPAPATVALRLLPPEGLAPWTATGGDARVIEVEGAPLCVVEGGGRAAVAVPGPHDPAAFDLVRAHVLSEGGGLVELALLRGGEVAFAAPARSLSAARRAEAVELDLPRSAEGAAPFDELRIAFASRAGAVLGIGAVELVRRPLARRLAPGDAEPALVALGSDARRAFVVTDERPLAVTARVGPGRYALSFTCAWPAEVRDGAAPRLSVAARGGGPAATADVPLTPARAWMRGPRVEVEAREERELRFELSVEAGGAPVACAVADVAVTPVGAAPDDERTVLLVTSDTHRADYLGAARSGVSVRTPELDRLAARGVLFEDCWSSTNITNPSHAALMTGLSPRDTRVVTNTVPLSGEASTLAERFRAAGFLCYAVVSVTNLGDAGSGLGQGFDRMATPPSPPVGDAADAVDRALAWLPEAAGRPLFLWLHLFDAHGPYAPPGSHDRLYWPEGRDPGAAPAEGALPADALPEWLAGVRDPAFPEAQYRAEVTYLDRELGRLLAAPRIARGAIAVTADHGESLGDHETYYDHVLLYPDTLRVPLVLAAPGLPRGVRVSAPVRQTDVGRTLLDLAGLASAEFPGESLLATLVDGARREAEPARFALAAQGNAASVSRGSTYLILHLVAHREHQSLRSFAKHQVELYDLAADPGCERDLVAERADAARALRAELVAWLAGLADTGLAGAATDDPEQLRVLAGLGYVSHETSLARGAWFEPDGCGWCRRFE